GQRVAREARVGEHVENVERQVHCKARALGLAHIAGFPGHFQAPPREAAGGLQVPSRPTRRSTSLSQYFNAFTSAFTSYEGHRMAKLSPALTALMRACPCRRPRSLDNHRSISKRGRGGHGFH